MSSYGRTVLQTVGRSIKLTADGNPEPKIAGVTIDWSTVAAVAGSNVVLEDGVTILIGEKFLRYGQVVTRITASGKYGPYDPAAADGRQTLARGTAYLVESAIKENDLHSDYPPVIDGGRVWKDRILQSGVAAHTLALGPTLAEIETTFPRITYAPETPI